MKQIYSLKTIDTIVDQLIEKMKICTVFTFQGPLGAGKTTLIKRILARAGVKDLVASPTFMYVIPYVTDNGRNVYHFDLYRLSNLRDFQDAGFDEYLYEPGSWSFIEWPALIDSLLTKNVCRITLDYASEFERSIEITCRC